MSLRSEQNGMSTTELNLTPALTEEANKALAGHVKSYREGYEVVSSHGQLTDLGQGLLSRAHAYMLPPPLIFLFPASAFLPGTPPLCTRFWQCFSISIPLLSRDERIAPRRVPLFHRPGAKNLSSFLRHLSRNARRRGRRQC